MADSEKPTPPVPPSDSMRVRELDRGSSTLRRERVDTCDCGGTVYVEEIDTGRVVLYTWSYDDWDSDEYRLQSKATQTERRQYCDRCSMEVYF